VLFGVGMRDGCLKMGGVHMISMGRHGQDPDFGSPTAHREAETAKAHRG